MAVLEFCKQLKRAVSLKPKLQGRFQEVRHVRNMEYETRELVYSEQSQLKRVATCGFSSALVLTSHHDVPWMLIFKLGFTA